ncbi:MAG: protein kinase [Deltaproteobacteria bacterium]|nr:protein kinase [Deltaproteobacteria bacterium]MCW5801340.1 protein kinase [Deltaproteobacteria bacterium]
MTDVQEQVSRSLRLVGRVLGEKFKLTACIGIGGSGAVYKADQMALGRTVAVKILNEELSADAKMIKRFRDEAMSASRLNHPNCVSIIDYGQSSDGLLYLAMEYVKGPTLTQLLVNENPLAVDRVIDIVIQSLAGIEEAHLAGVVHADLKADNIILDQRRAGVDIVKIVDFGIARLVTGVRDPEDRSISGTPEYMAPEVISGAPPSFASDVYAVGIILYELLAYKTPFFAGSTTEILANHLKAMIPSLASRREQVPRELDAVVAKSLAKHPSDRYHSAAEMREALGTIQTQRRRAQATPAPISDKCEACGTSCAPTFKFCPECGTDRRRPVVKAPETPPPQTDVLPLQFIGRTDELATLLAHMRSAPSPMSGRATGLLVMGFEGAGRSALLRHAYDNVGQETRVIYQIGPDPSGLAAPYYPVRSLLAAVLQLPPVSNEQELRDAVLGLGLNERDVPGIAQLFGHPTTLLELEPPVRRREMVWSTLRALERAAQQGAVTVVCEDVDRFDHPSLEILRRATEPSELALPPIVMTSTTAFGSQWPASVPRLEVGALEADDLKRIVTSLEKAGVRGLPDAQTLFETTRAYPGHIEHVVRYLLEGGKAEDTATSLPDLIAARLSLLKQSTRDVLQAAAVLGCEPQLDLLRSMLSGDQLEAAMADAERSGLLGHDPSGELKFTSRLVRDIVYDATPIEVRRSLHAAAAAAVERLSPDVALLGHHHDLSGHAKQAIPLLRRAGDHAAEQLDDAGAGQFYYRALVAVRQAVQIGDDDGTAEGQFVQLSVRLADVLRTRGETALARGVLAEARDWSGAPVYMALIDRAGGAIALSEGDVDGAISALRRGVGRAISTGDMNLVCELYLDLSNALMRGGNSDSALHELVECIDLATLGEGFTAIDGPDVFWRILKAQSQIIDGTGDAYKALRLAEAALFHAQRVRSRLGAARVQQLLAQLCEKAGLGGKADRYRAAAIAEMRSLGDRRATAELLLNDTPARGAVVVTTSRLDDAIALTKEIGWTEGHERAKRKSSPPPTVKS